MINIWQDNQKRHSPSRFSWSSWDLEGTTSYSKVMSGQCMQNLQKYEESSFANLCLIKTVGKWRERKREDFYVRNFPNALWSFSLLGRKLLHPCFKPSEGGFKRPTLRAGPVSFGVWGTSMRHWLKISFRVAERMRKWGREAEQKREKKARVEQGWMSISRGPIVGNQLQPASCLRFWIFFKGIPLGATCPVTEGWTTGSQGAVEGAAPRGIGSKEVTGLHWKVSSRKSTKAS